MASFDILIQRFIRRFKDALPGSTTASRLMRPSSRWRHLPPEQRAAAYVQFHRTQQELKRIHIEQKLSPKLVNFLFEIVFSEAGLLIGLVVLLSVAFLIVNP